MSDYRVTVEWTTGAAPADFLRGRYSRAHRWLFDGGAIVPGSSSPSVVRLPWSSAEAVDPEEAFVAAISSCHMLTFLYLAMKAGFVVTSYRDEAVGLMTKTPAGVEWVSKVTLSPVIAYGEVQPTAEQLAELHHHAHAECFIANSVKTEIVVATS